jgi:REP element-mobilizing transposase RayT
MMVVERLLPFPIYGFLRPTNYFCLHGSRKYAVAGSYVLGEAYLFTVNLFDRNQTLLTEHADLLREAIRWIKVRRPFEINAWMKLPNHIHAVRTLPEGNADCSSR